MAYQEGTIADGPNGPLIFQGGRWVPMGGASQATAIPIPPSPRSVRDERRADAREDRDTAAASRDDARTGIAVRGEGRDIANTSFDHTKDLRDEFNKLPDVQDYRAAIKAYSTALKTAENPAGDLNLIYAFAKIMDPNSVVREGEQAAVAGGDTLFGQIQARLKKELGESGTFRPEYRNQLRRELQNRVSELNDAYEGQRSQYSGFANQLGVDPQVVIGQHDGTRFHNDVLEYWKKQGVPVLPEGKDALGNPLPNGARLEGPPPGGRGYQNSLIGQGMSGVNEGIGNAMGLPVDVLTAVMNFAPKAINAAANTDIPEIENPVGGSQWFKDRMDGWGTYAPSKSGKNQFVRRVGQSVGSAAVPLMGSVSSIPKIGAGLVSAAGGGVGGATAQRMFPGNPLAEFAGETLGGGVTGMGLLGSQTRSAQRKLEAAIPTVDQLKEKAGGLYKKAEALGVTAGPTMTTQLSDDIAALLRREGHVSPTGRISDVYPKVKEAKQLVDDYAGGPMSPVQMQTVRKIMADGLNSPEASERRTASLLTDTFDDWANPLAPELEQARDVSSRYLNAQKLETARELAGARAGQFTGSGFENALRTEYRALDRNAIKGNGRYGADTKQAIENVSRGTPASNAARGLGRFAPTGPVSAGLGTGIPAAVGTAIGGPAMGVALGGTAAGLGSLGRVAATRMGIRNADIAELTARNGGAIPQAPMLDPETEKAIAAVLAAQQGTLLRAPRKPKRRQR